VKDEYRHPIGFLLSHAIPESTWEVITMEFCIELSLTVRRHDPIVVTIDTLTKSLHFVLVCMHLVPGIARVYFNNILRLLDIPRESYTISDSVVAR
jgi:hypothetical protein